MSTRLFGLSGRRGIVAAITSLLAATAVMLPATAAGAHSSSTGKAAELQRLRDSAGHGPTADAAASQAGHVSGRTQVSALAAADTPLTAPPTTTPTDLTVTGTAGVVAISATTTAPYVLFSADGTALGAPATATAGTASADEATWGWANGAHTVTAADCADIDPADCNIAAPATTTFDLANAAPVITAPAHGATITGGFTIRATVDGGGVRFLIDGKRRGFDATKPYTFAYTGSALASGPHTITAVQCSTDQSSCAGPVSAPVRITSASLHPHIVSINPAVFSPNGDRYKDATKLTYSLPDTETVHVSVTNAAGTVVRGPLRLGTLGRGAHAWTWGGRSNSSRVVSSGRYRVTLSTTATVHGALVKGMTWHSVTVDNHAPTIGSLSYLRRIYPYRDGYKDALPAKFRLGERATTTMTVRNPAHHTVRTLRSMQAPGWVSLSWNGRYASGRMVPAGTYTWRLTARDAAGNRRNTAWRAVTVSGKRLISKSVVIRRNGDSYASVGASDPSCAEASTSLSDYKHGVWLANSCLFSSEIVAAFYHVSLPAAVVYSHFTVQAYGWALYAPSSMTTGFGVHGGSSDFGIGGFYKIATQREGWHTIGSINAARYVSATHRANIAATVTSDDAPDDFDIKLVQITLRYKVLG